MWLAVWDFLPHWWRSPSRCVGRTPRPRGKKTRRRIHKADGGVERGPGGPPHFECWLARYGCSSFVRTHFLASFSTAGVAEGTGADRYRCWPGRQYSGGVSGRKADAGGWRREYRWTFGNRAKSKIDIGEDVVLALSLAALHPQDRRSGADPRPRRPAAGGLPALIENFHPSELWTGATPPSDAWSQVRRKANDPGVKHQRGCTVAESFNFGGGAG